MKLYGTIAAVFAGLLLTACADDEQVFSAASQFQTERNVCTEISQLAFSAQRAAYALDHEVASRDFQQIIAIYAENPQAERCEVNFSPVVAKIHQGLVLSNQRYFLLADGLFKEAAEALGDRTDPVSRRARALLFSHQAMHQMNKREPTSAGDLAARWLVEFGGDDDQVGARLEGELFGVSPELKRSLLSRAQAHYVVGSVETLAEGDNACNRDALTHAEEALQISSALGNDAAEGRFNLLLAQSHYCGGNLPAAEQAASAAIEKLEDIVPDTTLHAHALFLHGAILSAQGSRTLALSTFDQGIAIYRDKAVGLEYDTVFPYILLIRELARPEVGEITTEEFNIRMFDVAQLVRSSLASSDIARAALTFEAGDSDAALLVRRWQQAKEDVGFLLAEKIQVARALPGVEYDTDQRLAKAQSLEADLREQVEEVAPDYFAALEAPAALADVQAQLAPDEALLQVLTGGPLATVIFVERDNVEVFFPAVRGADLDRAIQAVLDGISQDENGEYPEFKIGVSSLIYWAFFESIDARVREKNRLFVSTSGALQRMPFELLATNGPEEAFEIRGPDYHGATWISDSVEFSYLPSPRNLIDIRLDSGVSKAGRDIMVLGDPQTNITADRLVSDNSLPDECFPTAAQVVALGDLPGVRDSVSNIEEIFGGNASKIVGPDFTKNALLERGSRGELRGYQILHFATHGILWEDLNCFTEPALTLSMGASKGDDGLLRTAEIRRLDLDAQLVVLAACDSIGAVRDTGLTTGDNLQGLARAFFGAGARSVIASHWQVDDSATRDIMGIVYRELKANPGTSFGQALNIARRQVRDSVDPVTGTNRVHPAFWAPLVLIGDGNAGLVGPSGS